MEPERRRSRGIGAIFFLVALGVIAVHAQRTAVPEENDAVRTRATALERAPETETVAVRPWRDGLDLGALEYTEIGSGSTAPNSEDSPPPREGEEKTPDRTRSRYTQTLADGHRVVYTLDPVLHESALQIFRNREVPFAAAVVLDIRDNAVLAMAAHSAMDPQVDPLEILTTSWAPAASTFKLVTAASLIEHGRANARTRACFSGGLRGITDDLLRDDPKRDTRCATLSAAIAHSHNVVIAKLALGHLEREQLAGTAQSLGWGREIAFEFPVETSPASIPADPRERAKVAAGFWHVDMSPVHGALLASVFARGGLWQSPHVVAQVLGPEGEDETPALARAERVLPSEAAREVATMMLATTTEGTARKSFRDGNGAPYIREVAVAGKTGSLTGRRPPALNYNWFIGHAPADRPEIAFAVLLANEPKWRIKAHYAARRLVQIYLERRDAIAELRQTRLRADGTLARPSPASSKVARRTGEGDDPEAGAAPVAASEQSATDDLPPVPGPVPSERSG